MHSGPRIIALPQERPNYRRFTIYMTIGLAGALAVMAFRLAQYDAYLAAVPV